MVKACLVLDVKPKRDFIKENMKRMKKDAQQIRKQAANGTPLRGNSRGAMKPRDLPEMIVIKEASQDFNKRGSSASLNFGCGSTASSASRCADSATREMSSQTGDINDDLFLIDVNIR